MPSFEEVDAIGGAPFVPPSLPSSELQGSPNPALAKALGLNLDNEDTPSTQEQSSAGLQKQPVHDAQKKSDSEGQKVVDNYSAKIQDRAEELYRTEERLALKDPMYIQKLIDSKDSTDRKIAEKILLRNADQFGASSIEDFQKALIDKSDLSPAEKKMEIQSQEIEKLKKNQQDQAWNDWKRANQIGKDVEPILDEVHTLYPNLPEFEALALARGKMGISQTVQGMQTKRTTAAQTGASGGVPESDEEVFESPLARRLIRDPKKTKEFAKDYLRQFTR